MGELERIKRKKLIELQRRALLNKKLKEMKEKEEKLEESLPKDPQERLIMSWMTPDAYKYFQDIKRRDRRVSNIIEQVLIMLIQKKLMKHQLTYQQLIIIEKKILGKGPTIKIKRPGKELTDFTDLFRK